MVYGEGMGACWTIVPGLVESAPGSEPEGNGCDRGGDWLALGSGTGS